ncbi:RICIN domain-containing protein, partial [Spirosoma soli]
HYSASGSFIDRIMYLQNNYSCYIDQNNPTRVFAQFLEFGVDYSKPLAANNGSWTLLKNWRATMPANYFEVLTINHTYISEIFRDVLTMSNGRTYGFLRRFSDNKWVVVELPANGPIRVTKVAFDAQNRYTYHITKDGSLKQSVNNFSGTSGTVNWQTRPLTGFDANNDPIWGAPQDYATAPINSGGEPITWKGGGGRTGETTSSNVMITFDDGKVDGALGGGYHLGGIRVNDNKWLWKTAHATSVGYVGEYPTDGAYDVGNNVEYAGGGFSVFERNIFWNYHGEFWKNSQVNKWQHVYDNGLLVGIFGKTGIQARVEAPDGGAVPGMAGNVLLGTVVKAPNGNIYLYHAEEFGWSGVHRWRIDGLNTIQEQAIPLQNLVSASVPESPLDGVDLLNGLPRQNVVQNGTAGWNRNPVEENNTSFDNKWTVKTGLMSYDRFASTDLYVNFSKPNATYTVTRDLGTTSSLVAWALKGVITFNGTNPNNGAPDQFDSGGCYFEVLDNNGRVLARIYNQVFFDQANVPVKLFGNNQVIAQGEYFKPSTATGTGADPIEISMSNGTLTIKYRDFAPVTTSAFDKTGNLQSPKTVRLFFWSNGRNYERTIDVQSLRFYATAAPTNTIKPTVESADTYFIKAKHSGKYLDVANVSTADGASIIQWSYTGGTNQQWQLTNLNTGYYTMKAVHSSKMLNIPGASMVDGTAANQWSANGQANQQFKLVDAGEGYYKIVGNNSQKCLDIRYASTADGAVLQQTFCSTSDSQKFLLVKAGTGGGRVGAVEATSEHTEPTIKLYPNPAVNEVTIKGAQGAAITIVDGLGRIKLTTVSQADLFTFPVTSLPTGEYIIQIKKDDAYITSRKLIISGL